MLPTPIARLLALGGELAPPAPGQPRRKFELAHMRTLLEALGNPQQAFPSVLIAGTNGKGSTAATLASILQAAGHRVGLYTSPHLEQPNERIRINGAAISDAALTAHFLRVEATSAALVASAALPHPPSFFETITAIAFLHLAGTPLSETGQTTSPGDPPAEASPVQYAVQPAVQIAILEVGLGGRLDATNVVDPLVSVLADIALDHTEWLGNTLAAITREKAGILRPHGILVTLPQHPEANQTIGEVAVPLALEAINAADYLPLRMNERPAPAVSLADALRNRYSLGLPPDVFEGAILQIDSPLAGEHQQRNIALALATALALHRRHGFALSPSAIEAGIRATAWPGRLQLLPPPAASEAASQAPSQASIQASSQVQSEVIRQAPILMDAAHNPAGAWALRAALSPLPIEGRRTLVFGCMSDKAIGELAQILFPVFDQVLLTTFPSPRAASLAALEAAAAPTGADYRSFTDPSLALQAAQSSTPKDGLIVLAGSIALLGTLSTLLHAEPRGNS